jgi:hypothetical protein
MLPNVFLINRGLFTVLVANHVLFKAGVYEKSLYGI